MKKTLEELLDGCGPEELDGLIPDDPAALLPREAMERIQDKVLKALPQKPAGRHVRLRPWLRAAVAACLCLAVGLGGIAVAAEGKEYNTAVEFFHENGLSTEGLSRGEVKDVYRDITTRSFTNGKTAQVLERTVPGVEIGQREPTPEELAALWDRNVWMNASPAAGDSFKIEYLYKPSEELGFDVLDRSIVECYRGGELLWTAEFPDLVVEDGMFTPDGTAVWGRNDTWSSEQTTRSWLARVDGSGNILWQRQLDHGFRHEYVAQVLDNGDGTWAAVSRGDLNYLCLSQYDTEGSELSFTKTPVGNYGIWNANRLGEGYLVQLGNMVDGETARLARLDRDGNFIDTLTYKGEDCDYTITDMIEFGGRIYLSAYAVPKQNGGGGRDEIGNVLEYLFSNDIREISSEELTPMVRDNYTAVLLLCGPEGGALETFYSVKGSLGGKLAVNDAGELTWDVESIASTFFSPATSSFTIGGTCQVFRYAFDSAGTLLRQEDTGETAPYHR